MPAAPAMAVRQCTSSACTYHRSASGSLPRFCDGRGGARGGAARQGGRQARLQGPRLRRHRLQLLLRCTPHQTPAPRRASTYIPPLLLHSSCATATNTHRPSANPPGGQSRSHRPACASRGAGARAREQAGRVCVSECRICAAACSMPSTAVLVLRLQRLQPCHSSPLRIAAATSAPTAATPNSREPRVTARDTHLPSRWPGTLAPGSHRGRAAALAATLLLEACWDGGRGHKTQPHARDGQCNKGRHPGEGASVRLDSLKCALHALLSDHLCCAGGQAACLQGERHCVCDGCVLDPPATAAAADAVTGDVSACGAL
jgi:hypothetical protein